MENKIDILSLSHAELREFIAELGEPKYRADQIYTFLMRGASSFEEMNNIPKKLIEKLIEKYKVENEYTDEIRRVGFQI